MAEVVNWKVWARQRMNEGKCVQVAVTATNACHWAYLTTSGKVCTRVNGFIEDAYEDDEYETLDLPPNMTWENVCRLQNVLIRAMNEGDNINWGKTK